MLNVLFQNAGVKRDTRVGVCLESNIKYPPTQLPVPAPWEGARLGTGGSVCALHTAKR